MKYGWLRKNTVGFTIVEVLIVLAVSSAMLISAIILINGRQNKTEFMVAINDITQQLQEVINEVSTGYYPTGMNYTCKEVNASPPRPDVPLDKQIIPQFSAGTSSQGTNGQCIYMGTAIHFGVKANDGTIRASSYTTYPVVGIRDYTKNLCSDSGTTQCDLNKANPSLLYPTAGAVGAASSGEQDAPDYSQDQILKYGLKFVWIKPTDTSILPHYFDGVTHSSPSVIAFVVNLGIAGQGVNNLVSGSLHLDPLIMTEPVPTTYGTYPGFTTSTPAGVNYPNYAGGSNQTKAQAAANFDNYFHNSTVLPVAGTQVCFASGTTNQSGLITISGNASAQSVSLQIKDGLTCG